MTEPATGEPDIPAEDLMDPSEPATGDTEPADTASNDPAETAAPEMTLEQWRDLARKNEKRAKDNAAAAKELDKLKRTMMSDTERAIAEARADERTSVEREYAGRLAASAIREKAVGRGIDVDALIEAVDASRFLGDDLEPDREAIDAWLSRISPQSQQGNQSVAPFVVDLGQGTPSNAMPLNGDPIERALRQSLGMT